MKYSLYLRSTKLMFSSAMLALVLLMGTGTALSQPEGTARPEVSRANVVGEATRLLAQINPINVAIKGLIGEAAGALDAVLQKQLEHLQSVIQIAINKLNDAARQRTDQVDERVRDQIADLNRQVQDHLLQFNALVGKHQSTLDSSIRQRINQFNFGLANTLASIKWLPTLPLLMLEGDAITTFKQAGGTTTLFIGGSSFVKYGKPYAFLSGNTVTGKRWFSPSNEIELGVPVASMGRMEISIPNEVIPDQYGPQAFSLKLQIRDTNGIIPHYSEQSVRVNICGRLPKITARLVVWASGRQWDRTTAPLKDMLHASTPKGNDSSRDTACLPNIPPSGWEFDNSAPDFGIVFGSENHNNHHEVVRPNASSPCLTAYADGSDGNAHQNIHDVRMKLIRVIDRPQCNAPWRSEPLNLPYGRLVQPDVQDRIRGASAGACDEARARAIPVPHLRVEFLEESGRVVETTPDLPVGVEVVALEGAVKVKLNDGGLIDLNLTPLCVWHVKPAGQ